MPKTADTKHFDNLGKPIRVRIDNLVTGTVQSQQIDPQIPRGYVYKVKKVVFEVAANLVLGNADEQAMQMALVNDPDDQVTTIMPEGEVQHDVICSCSILARNFFTTSGGLHYRNPRVVYDFRESDLEFVSARPLRFNIDPLDMTDEVTDVDCYVYGTFEKITEQCALEILDIL